MDASKLPPLMRDYLDSKPRDARDLFERYATVFLVMRDIGPEDFRCLYVFAMDMAEWALKEKQKLQEEEGVL